MPSSTGNARGAVLTGFARDAARHTAMNNFRAEMNAVFREEVAALTRLVLEGYAAHSLKKHPDATGDHFRVTTAVQNVGDFT